MIPGTNRSVMSLLDVTGRRRAEQALQESEERLNLALMAANDGLVDWDVGTGTTFYSPRCFTMLGYEPGAFVPTVSSLLSLAHPEDRDRVEAALTGMATGGRDRLETGVPGAVTHPGDGSTCWTGSRWSAGMRMGCRSGSWERTLISQRGKRPRENS
jgi:PAS domain-containing protein